MLAHGRTAKTTDHNHPIEKVDEGELTDWQQVRDCLPPQLRAFLDSLRDGTAEE